jgi:hypothetical protein
MAVTARRYTRGMTIKTYHGSCHCKRVTFEADLDLAIGTGKCNCSFCWKVRNWSIVVKPDALRPLTGRDEMTIYTFGSQQGQHAFCKYCGVRTYSWGNVPEIGGEFVSINLSSLDDLDPAELADSPVKHMDGRADSWWTTPAETRHL